MICSKDDYVIVRTDKKFTLIKVDNVSETTVSGIVQKGLPYYSDKLIIEHHNVVANIGPEPIQGTAFNCVIEPYWKTIPIEFGTIHFFRRISRVEWKALQLAVKKACNWLVLAGLEHITPIDIHIRPPKGKVEGTWKSSSDEDVPHILILRPKEFGTRNLVRILIHEFAIGILDLIMPGKFKVSWINLYHSFIVLNSVSEKELAALLTTIEDAEQFKYIKSSLSNQRDVIIFRACLDYIKRYHNLSRKHVETIFDSGNSIGHLWPMSTIQLMDMEDSITEKALHSPEEFFAEAVSLHATNILLPKKIESLVTRSLAVCKE